MSAPRNPGGVRRQRHQFAGRRGAAGRARQARAGAGTQRPARRLHPHRGTVPGYRHEVFSSWHPLFVGSRCRTQVRAGTGRAGSAARRLFDRPGRAGRPGPGAQAGHDAAGAWTRSRPATARPCRTWPRAHVRRGRRADLRPAGQESLQLGSAQAAVQRMAQARAGRHDRPPPARWRISAAGPSARCARTRRARDRALDPAFRPGAGRCRFGADRQADLRRRGQRRHARDRGRRQPAGRGAGPRHRESRRPAADQRAGGPACWSRARDGAPVPPACWPTAAACARDVVCNVTPQQLTASCCPTRRRRPSAQAYPGWLHAAAFRVERAASLDGPSWSRCRWCT